jgi:hypothetical protein
LTVFGNRNESDAEVPDFGLSDEHEVGPGHFGFLCFVGMLAAWFGIDPSPGFDWAGLVLFLIGSVLWMLDPPPQLRFLDSGVSLAAVGVMGVGYGWWQHRLPIGIVGVLFLVLSLVAAVLRHRARRSDTVAQQADGGRPTRG